MTAITWNGFLGLNPATDACAQSSNEADIAHNAKLWHNRIDPWRKPKLVRAVENACVAFKKGCCWLTSPDPCARFTELKPCGTCVRSAPDRIPREITIVDECTCEFTECPLGFPCPDQPTCEPDVPMEPECHLSQLRSYLVAYGDECNHGAPSLMCDMRPCASKDDCFTVGLPQPPELYCNVTKIYIFRLVTTWDSQGEGGFLTEATLQSDSSQFLSQGFLDQQNTDTACYLVGCVDIGTTSFSDCGGVSEAQMCQSLLTDDWETPDCGWLVDGVTDRGAAVAGQLGSDKIHFSEYNTFFAWPCKYEITLENDYIRACVCGDTVFVFTEGGVEIITERQDTLETFCRDKQIVKRALPLCNSKALVCLDNAVVFASAEGLYRIDLNGQVENLTPNMAPDNWAQMDPCTMRLGMCGNRLMITSDRFSGVYDIDLFRDNSRATNTLTTISHCPSCWVADDCGNCYMVASDGIYEWDKGDEFEEFRWRSGSRRYPNRSQVSALQVQHAGTSPKYCTPCTTYIGVYADRCLVFERFVNSSESVRMPRCCGHEFAVEVRGKQSICGVSIAGGIQCLEMPQGAVA